MALLAAHALAPAVAAELLDEVDSRRSAATAAPPSMSRLAASVAAPSPAPAAPAVAPSLWTPAPRAFGPRLAVVPPPPPSASTSAAAASALALEMAAGAAGGSGDGGPTSVPPPLADAAARLRWLATMVDGIANSASELSAELGALDDAMARAQVGAEVGRRSAQLRSLRERADAALLQSLAGAVGDGGSSDDGSSGGRSDHVGAAIDGDAGR